MKQNNKKLYPLKRNDLKFLFVNHIGEKLVLDSLHQAKRFGFKIMQFNAVVATNIRARHLYERLGFKQLGIIPNGFRLKNKEYVDICPYFTEIV